MKYWKMKMTVQSPIHIGSGDIFGRNQYIYQEKNRKAYVYFLKEMKWAEYLNKENLLDKFVYTMERNPTRFSIFSFLNEEKAYNNPRNMDQVIEELIKTGVCSNPLTADVEYTKNPKDALNDIHTFIKDSEGRMYIPGSALKGSFRTAILTAMIRKDRNRYDKYWRDIKGIVQQNERIKNERQKRGMLKREIGKIIERLERETLIPATNGGKRNMVDSLFKSFHVSDSTPVSEKGVLIRKADIGEDENDPHTIFLWRECIMPGEELFFTIGIDEKEMGKTGISDAKSLIKCAQDFVDFQYDDLLFKSFGDLKALDEMKKNDLILGGGTGYISKSIIYALAPSVEDGVYVVKKIMKEQFKKGHHDEGEDISPHTLKLAKMGNRYQIMGMCKLETVEELC